MKTLIAAALLLLTCVTAQASSVQTILATKASATSTTPAPTDFYGVQFTLQLPVGITPRFDAQSTEPYTIDPASIVMLDTSLLPASAVVSANYHPSTSSTTGDTVMIALANLNGVKFGTLGSIWFDFKPDFTLKYNTKTTLPKNATITLLGYQLFDQSGNEIPGSQARLSISKNYVWY